MLFPKFTAAFAAAVLMFSSTAVLKAADIVETAVGAGTFKTLAAALGAAELVDTLKTYALDHHESLKRMMGDLSQLRAWRTNL